jgi:hypothetical protein
MDDKAKQDVNHTIRRGAELAYQLLLRARAAGPRDTLASSERPMVLGSRPVLTLVAAAGVLCVGVLGFLGVIAVALKASEYGLEPVLSYVSGHLFRALLIPGILPFLAAGVLVIGLPYALKSQEPAQFLIGLAGVVLALVGFWQLPRLIALLRAGSGLKELEGPFLFGALAVLGLVLVGGILLIASCDWIRDQDASNHHPWDARDTGGNDT